MFQTNTPPTGAFFLILPSSILPPLFPILKLLTCSLSSAVFFPYLFFPADAKTSHSCSIEDREGPALSDVLFIPTDDLKCISYIPFCIPSTHPVPHALSQFKSSRAKELAELIQIWDAVSDLMRQAQLVEKKRSNSLSAAWPGNNSCSKISQMSRKCTRMHVCAALNGSCKTSWMHIISIRPSLLEC